MKKLKVWGIVTVILILIAIVATGIFGYTFWGILYEG
mgnify:CR=1 FL=1